MKIRYLTKKDAEEFRDTLLHDEWGSRVLAHSGGGLLEFEHGRWNAVFVIENGDNLIGFAQLDFLSIPSEARIGATYIKDQQRRRGYGEKLISFLEEYAKRNWPVRMITAFTIENPPMEKFLKKHKYEKLGVFKKYIYYNGEYHDEAGWIKRIEK